MNNITVDGTVKDILALVEIHNKIIYKTPLFFSYVT